MSHQSTRDWQPTYLTSWSPCSPTINRSKSPSEIYEYADYTLYKNYYDAGYLPIGSREINGYSQARRPCIASKVVSPKAYSVSKRTSPYIQERYAINTNLERLPDRVSCRTYTKCRPKVPRIVPYPYASERYFCRSPPSTSTDGPRCFLERLVPAAYSQETEREIKTRERKKSVSVPVQRSYESQPFASFGVPPQESFSVTKNSYLAHSRSHHEIQVGTSDVILQTGSCSRCRVARQPSPYLIIPINASETSLKCAGCLAREEHSTDEIAGSDDDSEVWVRCLRPGCEPFPCLTKSGRCPGPIIVPCFRYEDGGYVQRLPGSIFKRNGLQDVEFNNKGLAKYIRSDAMAYYNCDMM